MEFSKSQHLILQRLKTRGPQSVKILAKQLDMTTMGARQHLAGLLTAGCVDQTQETRQNRGRPVHLWKLTQKGHQQFPDRHNQITIELIDVIRDSLGDSGLNDLIQRHGGNLEKRYQSVLESVTGLPDKIQRLAQLRTEDGFMAEIRLLPDGWLLIENHCAICAAAEACPQFCHSELQLFTNLLGTSVDVNRVDHLLSGDRRCAYKIVLAATE